MVETVTMHIRPEIHRLYPPPKQFEDIWSKGAVHSHQFASLQTKERAARIHAPTGTGKSRAASFYSVAPFHTGNEERIQATFAYPTNLLTHHQFEKGLVDGLHDNLGYGKPRWVTWTPDSSSDVGIPYQRLEIVGGGELWIAKLTGTDMAELLRASSEFGRKADLLQDFLDWLNTNHNFLVASPDLLAYAIHEQYSSKSLKYHKTVKRRLHSLLRGRTLVLDEYHQYDPYTLVNLERLIEDKYLGPKRLLLLSATGRSDFFPSIPNLLEQGGLPEAIDSRQASRLIRVEFHFREMPEPEEEKEGLALYIHNSVVENRSRCSRLRANRIPLVQWDGTHKDRTEGGLGRDIHLVLGTSAVEVGLDLDADKLVTEWSPAWMDTNQVTQRIGRVGRRERDRPALAQIYVPGATRSLRSVLTSKNGGKLSKDELHELLLEASGTRPIRRQDYVSHYFFDEGSDSLTDKRLLEPSERLRYSFRPPGTQALFLDRTEEPPHVFLYERVAIVNRYELSPPTPDDFDMIDEGWRDLCRTLHIDLETHFHVIRGLRRERGYLPAPSGHIEDLRKPTIREHYLEGEERRDAASIFL